MKFLLSSILVLNALWSSVLAVPTVHDVFDAKVAQGLRLVKVGANIKPIWMTEEQTFDLIRAKTRFVSFYSS